MPSRIVLIADPAPEVRSFVKSALRSPEYRVFEARGGLEALCVCACHPVDLLLLAVDLPGIDGVRLAQKLSHRFPTLRVLYLSDAPGAGSAQDTIARPLHAEILRERIRQTLELAAVRKSPATEGTANGAVHQKSA
jgi:DNA-binding response OmpR family regulator